ncbi:MAG TPA: helix-turn-helix domain-containing protein [Anaerolineales bacterium]|nr:helix-turn-helix domain-containing protein [Anaerolineales bacterium]
MIKQRMSRKESQLQTRERLLDAALQVFSRRGYSAASVDEIAAEAGFSKGAVYSNFSSKEDLFLALIDRRFAADVQGYPGIINFMTDGLRLKNGPDFKEVVMEDRTWNILMVEFFLFALRDESNREKLAVRLSQLRQSMKENLAALYAELEKKPMLPVKELPWSIFSLGVGMMLQLFIDPEGLPDGVYERALQHLLR